MRIAIVIACASLFIFSAVRMYPQTSDALPALVKVLADSNDAQFQLDILKGMSDGLKGKRRVKMPFGWEQVAAKLARSPDSNVRELTKALSVMFGSDSAMQELRRTLMDTKADLLSRTNALEALLSTKDPKLPDSLHALLKEPSLRAPAMRAFAAYDDPQAPSAILAFYPELNESEKKDALNTLASRAIFARALLGAVSSGKVPAKDVTADLVRQMRNLKNAEIEKQVAQHWSESNQDKSREIARYRGMIESSAPGEPSRGRAIFARTCQQCHTLFDTGGKVGPDLTGSNRGDLEYILQNVIDPNAVVRND